MSPIKWFRQVLGWSSSAAAEQKLSAQIPDQAARVTHVYGPPPFVIGSPYPEASRIAASLRDFPSDWGWRMKGYELEHKPTGFVIWVANEDYGLAEVSGGHKTRFKPEEQAIIWPAAQAWLASRKTGFTGRLPKVRIGFDDGGWWCRTDGHPWVGRGGSPAHAYQSWARAVSVEARTDQRPGEILHVWSAAR
uniref:hypothetical protein n=1 Tax=Pseudomonas fulva TaxID=47880 RepID=UPI001F2E9198|nr:hypothetical protein [Pseudomonas fulva]